MSEPLMCEKCYWIHFDPIPDTCRNCGSELAQASCSGTAPEAEFLFDAECRVKVIGGYEPGGPCRVLLAPSVTTSIPSDGTRSQNTLL